MVFTMETDQVQKGFWQSVVKLSEGFNVNDATEPSWRDKDTSSTVNFII